MFKYGQDIPLENIPIVSSLTNGERMGEKEASPYIFTYAIDIPLDGLSQKE